MTYTQAKLIIWNPAAYSRDEVQKAAIWVLGKVGARREDVDQATNLL